MTPIATATAHAASVSALASHFMLDAATYQRAAELGYEGMDFYVVGRASAFGDVHGDVVAAAFAFFNPQQVRDGWERGRKVAPLDRAAQAWMEAAAAWAARLEGHFDLARLGDLASRVVDHASPAGAPLFGAWRAVDAPAGDAGRAIHAMNCLRELRNAYHGGAVLASGLTPEAAVHLRSPHMAALFGWGEPPAGLEELRADWEQAEAATDRAMAHAYEVLDEAERAELVELSDLAEQSAA